MTSELCCYRRLSQALRFFLAALFLAGLGACTSAPQVPDGEPARPLRPDTLEHNGWDRDCDLVHVHLDLSIDHEAEEVRGTCTQTLRGIRSSVDEIVLHGVDLEIESMQDGEGRQLQYTVDAPRLVVTLAEPLTAGQEQSIAVKYSAQPDRGLYFRESSKDFDGAAPQVWSQGQAEDHRYWIPMWDYPNDRASFSATLRASDGLVALSNGNLLGVEEQADGSRIYRWDLPQSIPTYLFAVALGRWEKYSDEWQGIPVEYWVGPGTGEEKARRAFGETPAMLEYFGDLLGTPYPYEKYAQVAVDHFVAGGMENATLTIQNDYVICSAAQAEELDGEARLLVAHELAHQWFGDLVTCFGWSHLWLNEAWASYLEVLFEGHVLGEQTMALRLERYRESYLRRGERTRKPLSEDWRTQLTDERCSHEYVKGPWVLAMLEREVGSADFWRGVQLYLERHADQLVTTGDFARAIFDSSGHNVEGFLEQWVKAGGHPEYLVQIQQRDGDTLLVRVQQTQRTSELVPLFDVGVEVEIADDRGAVRETLYVRNADETFELAYVGRLRDFQFDAGANVLCELQLEKPLEMWIEQASSPSAAQRWRALPALERARDQGRGQDQARSREQALQALMKISRKDGEVFLRRKANTGFAQPRFVPFLLERLHAEQDLLARVELLEILSHRHVSKATLEGIRESFEGHDTKRVTRALKSMEERLQRDKTHP